MALKLVQNAQLKGPESWSDWATRQLGSAAVGATQIPSTILQGIETLGSLPAIATVGLAEKLTGKNFGLSQILQSPIVKESLMKGGLSQEIEPHISQRFKEEPRHLGEFFLQRGLTQLPFSLAAAPQNLLQSGRRTGIGAGAATLAKGADLGPIGQAVSQAIAEGAYGRLTRPTLGQKASEAYAPITPIKQYGSVSTKSLDEPLKKIEYLWDKQTDSARKNMLKDIYDSVKQVTAAGKGDLRDLWEIRTSLGRDWSKLKKAGFQPVMTDLRQGINEAIKGAEAKLVNPKFWQSLTEGDKLKVAENIKTISGDFLKHIPTKFLKKIVLPAHAIDKTEYLIRAMANPTARKHYIDLATAAAEGSEKDFIKYANQLNKIVPKEELQKPKLKLVVNARIAPVNQV